MERERRPSRTLEPTTAPGRPCLVGTRCLLCPWSVFIPVQPLRPGRLISPRRRSSYSRRCRRTSREIPQPKRHPLLARYPPHHGWPLGKTNRTGYPSQPQRPPHPLQRFRSERLDRIRSPESTRIGERTWQGCSMSIIA